MALAGVKAAAKYLDLLLRDADERDQLAKDLLINVTGFFRDPTVFDFLAKTAFPISSAITRWTGRCESGSLAAVPVKRPIPSPCCFAREIHTLEARRSNCRSSRSYVDP